MTVILPFIIIPSIFLGVLVLFYLFVRHYIERDKVYFGTLASCAALLVAATFTLLLVPLDVYSVSINPEQSGIKGLRNLIQVGYYGSYLIIIFSLLITLPFCYFYYEAYTDYETQRQKRITQALKYTAFFILAFVIMIGVAFILKALRNGDDTDDWRKRILGELSNWEAFIIFLVSILSMAGLLVYVPYLSYGLSVLPIFLIKGRTNPVTEERESLLSEESELKILKKTQQQAANDRHIRAQTTLNGGNSTLSKMAEKYNYHSENGTTENKFVRKDYKLRETERKLEENKHKQSALKNESAWWSKCWNFLGPFRFILGIILLSFSLLLITQMIMSVTQRVINSKCGWKCGFTPDKIDSEKKFIPNPFDFLFHLIAPAFPLDLILFAVFLGYLGLCTVYAVAQLGVRILTWKMASISAQNTPANALVLAVAFIGFTIMAMSSQIIVSIPNYSAFGKQTFVNHTTPDPDTSNFLVQNDSVLNTFLIRNKKFFNSSSSDFADLSSPTSISSITNKNDNKDIPITSSTVLATKFDKRFISTIFKQSKKEEILEISKKNSENSISKNEEEISKNDDKNSTKMNISEDKKAVQCKFEYAELDDQCHITSFSKFMQKSNNFLPIFPLVQLIATIIFIFFFFIFLIYALCKKPETDKVWQSDDPDAPNYVA